MRGLRWHGGLGWVLWDTQNYGGRMRGRRRKSKADRQWDAKQKKQKGHQLAVKRRLNTAERLLSEVYEMESRVHERDLSPALTGRAKEALASARYALMNVRNR